MKAAIAAFAVTAMALAAATGTAHAQTAVSVQVATPHFGIRIGAPVPYFPPTAVYVPPFPVYAPVPVYVPAPPVVYAPTPWIVPALVVRPVVLAPGYGAVIRHKKRGHPDARRAFVPAVGYAYGRH